MKTKAELTAMIEQARDLTQQLDGLLGNITLGLEEAGEPAEDDEGIGDVCMTIYDGIADLEAHVNMLT